MKSDGSGPSRAGYWIGGSVALLGIACAVLWFVLGLMSFSNEIKGFDRVPADGEPRQVNLTRTGSYTAYHEPEAGSSADADPGVQAEVVGPDGRDVALSRYSGSLTYDNGGHSGSAAFTFRVDSPGTYQVRSSSPAAGELAIGRGLGKKLVTSIVGGFVLGLGGLGAGALMLIVTAIRRSSARRRAS